MKIIKRVIPPGSEVGITVGYDAILPDIEIGYVFATKPKKKKGIRWVTKNAKTGLYTIAASGKTPKLWRKL